MRRVHGVGTLGVMACWAAVACGPSQAEIASQQKAAAEARAKADADAAAVKAAADARAKADADAAAVKAAAEARAKADADAAAVKAEAEARAKADADAAAAKAEARAKADADAAAAKAEAEAKAAVTAARDAAREPPPRCKDGMVGVPAGTFTMGDAENTGKAGRVTVAAFCMDRTEVTVAAYSACVRRGKCTPAGADFFCNARVAGHGKHPINCVNWFQAKAYCKAQGQRLPTEEEWEYAARGTDGREYPWGNAAPSNQLCWNGEGNDLWIGEGNDLWIGEGNDLGKGWHMGTCAVGSYPAGRSPFGLDDMSGNVYEWTASPWSSTARGGRGGSWSSDRVARGGSWSGVVVSGVRSANRSRYVPSFRYGLLGFRCAGSPLP